MKPFSFPQSIIHKIKNAAPFHTSSENYGRRGGYYGDDDDETRSYKSVCIYVQNGLSEKLELFKVIAKGLLDIQRGGNRKYPLFVYGFGKTDKLQHEKRSFDLGYVNDYFSYDSIAKVISRISGKDHVSPAIIPELYPKTDIRSLYSGKIRIEREDLLVIIGMKGEVFFSERLQGKIKTSLKKQILLIEIDLLGGANFKFKPAELNYNIINNTMVIQRYFSKANLDRVKEDFGFFFNYIQSNPDFIGEFDFEIRGKYFNIYYKGNSLAKVTPKKNDTYDIEISEAFIDNKDKKYVRFKIPNAKNRRYSFNISQKDIHPFFQKSHLNQICSSIKARGFSEELVFEQSLITDNLNRDNLLIIDRQVTDSELGKRMDLLALSQIEENQFKFLIIEVKLGNNSELHEAVHGQLHYYINHVKQYFDDYKKCYEIQYEQKRELGLFDIPSHNSINIVRPVEGVIVVGGYKYLAESKIEILKAKYPGDNVIPKFHVL